MLGKLKKAGIGYTILGILLIAIGICFISFSNSLKVLSITIGVLLAIFATVYGILTIASTSRGVGFAFKITFAVIALICGVVTAVFNEKTIEIIVALIALLLIIDGSFKLNTAAISKRVTIRSWWIFLVLGALTIIGAFSVLKITPERTAVSSVISGLVLIIDGIANVLSSVYIPNLEKRVKKMLYKSMSQKEQ